MSESRSVLKSIQFKNNFRKMNPILKHIFTWLVGMMYKGSLVELNWIRSLWVGNVRNEEMDRLVKLVSTADLRRFYTFIICLKFGRGRFLLHLHSMAI